MRREREVHDLKLNAERQAHEQDCRRRSAEIQDAEQRTEKLHEQAQKDATAAQTLKADLEKRAARLSELFRGEQ